MISLAQKVTQENKHFPPRPAPPLPAHSPVSPLPSAPPCAIASCIPLHCVVFVATPLFLIFPSFFSCTVPPLLLLLLFPSATVPAALSWCTLDLSTLSMRALNHPSTPLVQPISRRAADSSRSAFNLSLNGCSVFCCCCTKEGGRKKREKNTHKKGVTRGARR